jgi:hypothetical protein
MEQIGCKRYFIRWRLWCWRSACCNGYPFIGDDNFLFFIELSDCHFECLFAHPEEGVDRIRIGLVVVGELAFIFLQEPEDFGGGVFDARISGAAGGHIDLGLAGGGLSGGENIFDKTGELVADPDIAINLVKMQDSGMAAVDDHDIPYIGAAVDGEVDDIVVFYRQVIVAEIGIDLFGGCQAAGFFIEVDLYEVVAAEAHAGDLFGFGHEQVLHEAPFEEGALRRETDDAEEDDITEDSFGLLGGGDGPVLAVVVHKDMEFIAGFCVVWCESFWQEDALTAVIEDEAHRELSFNDQVIVFTDVDHRVKVR